MKNLSTESGKEVIKSALEECSGNRRKAALQLDITERHLYRLMIRHDLK
jgi:DNA-binding NtrC family response regulator